MTKADELSAAARGEGCLGRSREDEPVFVLCARDPDAPATVESWAKAYRVRKIAAREWGERARAKFAEALALAGEMEAWRGHRIPDGSAGAVFSGTTAIAVPGEPAAGTPAKAAAPPPAQARVRKAAAPRKRR